MFIELPGILINASGWVRYSYFFWHYVLEIATTVESICVRLRGLAVRRKSQCIPLVPGFWNDSGGW